MRSNPVALLTVSALSMLGAALIVFPLFIEPRKSPAPHSNKSAVNLDAAAAGTASPQTLKAPEILALSFTHPGQRTIEGAKDGGRETAPTPKTNAEPTVADWRALGKITDEEGIVRLYFKTAREGRLIRIRQDGMEENGIALLEEKDDQYLVSINGERYIVPRRRK